ncbi:MAG: transcriptional regulator [Rhodobacteraceae bacterium]|nr:transcriptional regulator [Paracoccaceae bacterium]
MSHYHYTECGLNNVYIEGVHAALDHAGEDSIAIPAIGLLHKVIAEGIVNRPGKMTGQELKFLRSEMGLTQARLGEILKVRLLTVSRWERSETPIGSAAEMLIRLLAVEVLGLGKVLGVQSVSEKVSSSVRARDLHIDGSNPGKYHLLDAA